MLDVLLHLLVENRVSILGKDLHISIVADVAVVLVGVGSVSLEKHLFVLLMNLAPKKVFPKTNPQVGRDPKFNEVPNVHVLPRLLFLPLPHENNRELGSLLAVF